MATLSLGNQTIFTQSGNDAPVMDTNVNLSSANIKTSFNSLDTTASQGPTTDLTNTSLPIFACRAWVNFNGNEVTTVGSESHCTIRSSGNISKVVRTTSPGRYSVFFETPMPDGNYCVNEGANRAGANANASYTNIMNLTANGFEIVTVHSGAFQNIDILMLAIFR